MGVQTVICTPLVKLTFPTAMQPAFCLHLIIACVPYARRCVIWEFSRNVHVVQFVFSPLWVLSQVAVFRGPGSGQNHAYIVPTPTAMQPIFILRLMV